MIEVGWLWAVIGSLATYRLTRLIVQDDISAPLRERLRERTHTTFYGRDMSGHINDTRVERRHDRAPSRLAYKLCTCAWCLSVWLAAGVVLLARYCSGWFQYVAAALAFAAVAGWLSERL